MACLQLSRAGLSPALGLRSSPPRRRFHLPLRCRLQGGDADSNGEEPPESLFMKELKRRGMNKTSLLEDGGRGLYPPEEELEETGSDSSRGSGSRPRKGAVSMEYGQGLSNQRERSMALNSEGLEQRKARWRNYHTTLEFQYTLFSFRTYAQVLRQQRQRRRRPHLTLNESILFACRKKR